MKPMPLLKRPTSHLTKIREAATHARTHTLIETAIVVPSSNRKWLVLFRFEWERDRDPVACYLDNQIDLEIRSIWSRLPLPSPNIQFLIRLSKIGITSLMMLILCRFLVHVANGIVVVSSKLYYYMAFFASSSFKSVFHLLPIQTIANKSTLWFMR